MNDFQPSVALIVPCRNRPWDFNALNRLLRSLENSDFPKSYFLYVPVLTAPKGWDSRENAIIEALKSECEYILVSDNDCYVPKEWWLKSLDILKSDGQIGAIGYLNVADGMAQNDAIRPSGIFRDIKFTVGDPIPPVTICEPDGKGGYVEQQFSIFLPRFQSAEMLWDGFNLFKREFLLVSGVRNTAYNPIQHPNGPVNPLGKLLGDFTQGCTMKTVLANITIFHDKEVSV